MLEILLVQGYRYFIIVYAKFRRKLSQDAKYADAVWWYVWENFIKDWQNNDNIPTRIIVYEFVMNEFINTGVFFGQFIASFVELC